MNRKPCSLTITDRGEIKRFLDIAKDGDTVRVDLHGQDPVLIEDSNNINCLHVAPETCIDIRGCTQMMLYNEGSVYIFDSSAVCFAYNGREGSTPDFSAYNQSMAWSVNGGNIRLYDQSAAIVAGLFARQVVQAAGHSKVFVMNSATVHAYQNATIVVFGEAEVYAYDDVKIICKNKQATIIDKRNHHKYMGIK